MNKKMLWTGYVLSALPVLMLTMSAVAKLLKPPGFAEGMAKLGWEESQALGLAIIELACAIVYVIPRTVVLGAILMTGYLGGAVATHVRIGDPILNVVSPVVLGMLAWLGLYLRDVRLRELLPLRS
jgi:DoxX-like protein